jgi:gliding motility-associated-like protein
MSMGDAGSGSGCFSTGLHANWQYFSRPTIQFSFCGGRDTSEFNYKWSPSLGLNSDTIAQPSATMDTSMTYSVLITDTFGKCSDSVSIKLNVTSIDAGPDTAICPGDTIQLFPDFVKSCKGNGKFKWTPSNLFVNDTVQNPFVTASQTTTVTVTYSDTCNCTIKDSLTIHVDSVKFDIKAYDPDCGLNNGSFVFDMKGGWSPFTYSIDSGNTWGILDSVSQLPVGFYGLQVRDSLLCKSDVFPDTLANKGAPQIDSIAIINVSCGGFSDGEVEVFTRGGIQPLSYSVDSGKTWHNNRRITGLKAGNYRVFARGRFGCMSFPRDIVITEPDTIFIDFRVEDDSCFHQGHGFAVVNVRGGTPPVNYTWTGVAPSVGHNPVVVGDTSYTKLYAFNGYNLKVSDINNCGVDTTFSVGETPELKVDSMGHLPPTCFGYDDGQIFVKASGGNLPSQHQYNWLYEFSIDSGKTFYRSDVSDNAKPEYAQFNGRPGQTTFKIEKGDYNVVVVDGRGCTGKGVITVTEPPKMVLTTPQDSIRICVSTCTKLEVFSTGGNDVNHKYHWTPTVSNTNVANVCPDEDKTYSVYATDGKGCSSNGLLLKVDLFDSLRAIASNDTSICDGSGARLDVSATGGDGLGFNYLWQPFGDLSSAFIKNPIATPLKEKLYTVKVTDNCGSPAAYDSVRIKILPQPQVKFSTDSTSGCPPLISRFTNNTNASQTCVWNFGDGTSSSTCEDVFKTYSQSGKFDVKLVVTSADGCTDSLIKKKFIYTYAMPNASFSMTPQPTTILRPEISFEDNSNGRIINWMWNFAGMDTSMKRNPSYRFPDGVEGTYPVRLDVITDEGCKDDTIQVVKIGPEYYLYIPNSFSPNGDGRNDTWKPVGTGFDSDFYHVLVFDRWGKLVFESYDYSESWDGSIKNSEELAPVGVYTWKIVTGESKNEKERHDRFGNLTIIK